MLSVFHNSNNKLFLQKPHYDKDGKVISSVKKCFWYYISHNFIVDVINYIPLHKYLYKFIGQDTEAYVFSRIGSRCLELYIIFGWFNYVTDSHRTSLAYGTVS